MVFSYIKIALRNLKKRILFTTVNVFGLAVGIASFLLLFGYIFFEKQYDNFHTNGNRIYRTILERYKGEELKSKNPDLTPGFGNQIKNHINHIKGITRYSAPWGGSVFQKEELTIESKKLYYVDNDFLTMFSFDLFSGDVNTALKEPNSILLTKSKAKLFFEEGENIIGEQLEISNDYGKEKYTITGVINDPPANSHFNFEYLCSFNSIHSGEKWFYNNWSWLGFETFVELEDNSFLKSVELAIPDFITKYKTDPSEQDKEWVLKFQPLAEVNFNSNFSNKAINQNSKGNTIRLLSIISLLVLCISIGNYINLSTARSMERAKEVGVRKVLGASGKQISFQFFIESILTNLLAFLVSLVLFFLLIKPFYVLIGLEHSIQIYTHPLFWLYTSIIFLITIMLSGVYPSVIASNFKPMKVLKNKVVSAVGNSNFRRFLVGIQFLISTVLLVCTLIIIAQNKFLKNKDLGINIDNVEIVSKPRTMQKWKFKKKYRSFVKELEKLPEVDLVSASFSIPSRGTYGLGVGITPQNEHEHLNHLVIAVDENYIPLYKVPLIAGRNFNVNEILKNEVGIVSVNSMKSLGFFRPKEILGKYIKIDSYKDKIKIIGVINNHHHVSLQNEISTMILIPNGEKGFLSVPNYFSIKMNDGKSFSQISSRVNEIYNDFFENDIFESHFLKAQFSEQYKREERYQYVFSIFTTLAIVLGFMGVLGLSSYMLVLKEKEIAVRKVIGSSLRNIVWILSKDFIYTLSISGFLSVPIVLFFMKKWLLSFPYKITIEPSFFVKALLIISVLISLTVSFNLYQSLTKSPREALKEG